MPVISGRIRFATHFAVIVIGLGTAFAAGGWVKALDQSKQQTPVVVKLEDPPYRSMDANLYMQTSAEYRACCYQAFNLATHRLKEALIRTYSKKPAVILDLDETVLDNSVFQTMQCRNTLAFDPKLWAQWEQKDGNCVTLLPGAKEFIVEAKRAGVAIAYISSRSNTHRKETIQLLERLEVPPTSDNLLKLLTDVTTDKTKRRQEVEQDYDVLLLVGDNLRDFDEKLAFGKFDKTKPEEVANAILARKEAVDKERSKWGDRWIILPNPAYGEWPKPFGQGKADLNYLTPTLPTK